MTTRLTHRFSRATMPLLTALALMGVMPLTGCRNTDAIGSMEVIAMGSQPLLFAPAFSNAAYITREAEDSFWFSDVPLKTLLEHDATAPLQNGVFLHVQLVWIPLAGSTPVDATATNLVTRLIVVSGGEVGLYGGAGFARLKGERKSGPLQLDVEGGTLTLLEKTAGFTDLLSPAGFSATLQAPCDNDNATRWRRALSQFVTNAFGKSMWVDAREISRDSIALSAR